VQVHGGVVLPDLLAGPAQQVGHDARAQPARRIDPSLVLRVERGDEGTVAATSVQQAGRVAVPPPGELAEVAVQEVQRDVLHAPVAGIGGRCPLGIPQ
jgi:hypothetical protein